MNVSHRLLISIGAILFLAALVTACGGESAAPNEMPSTTNGGETEMETVAATPTDQPPPTEPSSPLPTPTEPPQDQTGGQAVSPLPTAIVPSEPAPLTGEVPQDLLEAVIEDLLGRIDASREAVVVDQAGAVTWRDGSLGCPQPGMMYTQALVPGYQIILQVGEETFDYHASERGHFVLCEEGMAEEGLPPGEGGGPVVDH